MRKSAKLFGLFLTATLTIACSDGSDSLSPSDSGTFSQATVTVPSEATPAFTPGTPGVVVENVKMLRQFGSTEINFNRAIYTRYYLPDRERAQPDAIVFLYSG
jgi:hypothetical protein